MQGAQQPTSPAQAQTSAPVQQNTTPTTPQVVTPPNQQPQQFQQTSVQQPQGQQAQTSAPVQRPAVPSQQPQPSPQPQKAVVQPPAQTLPSQSRSPMDALAHLPDQPINVIEVEGQQDTIIMDEKIVPGEQLIDKKVKNSAESVIEESLENLKEQYDDAKLNSIIIDQVKELIEIDNNLNSKIEDIRNNLKNEVEEREKLAKTVEMRYKELKELEGSIRKFIALYEVITNQFNPFVKQEDGAEQRMQELVKGKAFQQVDPSQHFVSKSGSRVASLAELTRMVEAMNEVEFKHHVTPVKNDFAIWIHEALGDEDLATEVSQHRTKESLVKVLKSKL